MTDKERVSAVIDRLYQHEFMMDELEASIDVYSKKHTNYDWEAEEFIHEIEKVKDILNKRLINDLKGILDML